MRDILSWFNPKTPWTIVYMLQQLEYDPVKLMSWWLKADSVNKAQKRGRLKLTVRAKLMLCLAYGTWLTCWLLGAGLTVRYASLLWLGWIFMAANLAFAVVWAATFGLQKLVIDPRYNASIEQASLKMQASSATKIAVLGSYGKTSMKELLATVLAEGKPKEEVVATPGNKNVPISHARWVNKLTGLEKILIFEYGEGAPGDILRLAKLSHPNYAVITGLAPAHLDQYPSLQAVAQDLASINQTVSPQNIYVNRQAAAVMDRLPKQAHGYDHKGVDGWQVSNIKVGFDGTSFTFSRGDKKMQLGSGLLGRHQVGPLAAVAVLAHKLGLTSRQIQDGLAKTMPFEHRMQPRHINGAWVIDDTYNGNIEGMRAGLALLAELPAKRRTYVTPGLVDQGAETKAVHEELGQLIAAAKPDRIVLMHNSVTDLIQAGLASGGYKGEIQLEPDPLSYYTNLEQFLAAGDVVLMQNDWPDSYK